MTEMLLTEIDHVAIAVPDLDAAVAYYEETFGATVAHRERIDSDGVEEALLKVADSYVQLLTPTSDSSPVAKYLEKKGPGIHHVAFEVDDVDAAVKELLAKGVRMIDQEPRGGAHGSRIAFIHPAETGGVLMELCQSHHE